MVLSELEIYSKRFFIYYFILLILCITVYRLISVMAYSYTEAMEEISVPSSIWEAPKI